MNPTDRIQPWPEDPRYWMFKGEPVLLLGGSVEDNLFQIERLEEHLDEMVAVGANYIRNVMSDRDPGNVYAYRRLDDGRFDLEEWGTDYWDRFSQLLELTAEREIIVQIELWDRFDHSREPYATDPYRPANNINYTGEESGLADEYPLHPAEDQQPFFHTVPGMAKYHPRYDLLRGYQERFVDKVCSHTLGYGHILYCMNNETSTEPGWGRYWIDHIRKRADEHGVEVQITDMFDDIHKGEDSAKLPIVRDDAEHYTYVDISQVNSRNFGDRHWERVNWIVKQVHTHPRPAGCVKTYGGGYTGFGSGGNEDGVERFVRNILAGCHGTRFHRPTAGNGLNNQAKATIRALRKLESVMKPWDLAPHMELLSDRLPDSAYCAANPGESYAVYFPYGRSVKLDLSGCESPMRLQWISVGTGEFVFEPEELAPGVVELTTRAAGGWIAAITKG
jgi:hypothetical protein